MFIRAVAEARWIRALPPPPSPRGRRMLSQACEWQANAGLKFVASDEHLMHNKYLVMHQLFIGSDELFQVSGTKRPPFSIIPFGQCKQANRQDNASLLPPPPRHTRLFFRRKQVIEVIRAPGLSSPVVSYCTLVFVRRRLPWSTSGGQACLLVQVTSWTSRTREETRHPCRRARRLFTHVHHKPRVPQIGTRAGYPQQPPAHPVPGTIYRNSSGITGSITAIESKLQMLHHPIVIVIVH